MKRLANKTALVTGAASGIGLATTRRLAEEGAKVLMTDINAAVGEAVCQELRTAGLDVRFLRQDVVDRDQWEQAIAAAISFGGALDVLVNNAGIVIASNVEACTLDDWRKTQSINVDSIFHGLQLGVVLCPSKFEDCHTPMSQFDLERS